MSNPSFSSSVRSTLFEAVGVYVVLLRVLVPTLLLVELLKALGGIELLARVLAPIMGVLGLPDVVGIIWAATLLTSIVPGLVVFAALASDLTLSVAQMSVLGILLLLAHSLPVEGAVARRAGVPWQTTLVLRIGGALLLGFLLNLLFSVTGYGSEVAVIGWLPETESRTTLGWIVSQAEMLASIFFVILALIVLLKGLRRIGVERVMHRALVPPLRWIGIAPAAANVTVIGLLLGLSYGAGLLIRDVDSGVMSARDSYLALCFLGLAHSMIDDTLLVLLLGADLFVIVFVRLAFAAIVVAILARVSETSMST